MYVINRDVTIEGKMNDETRPVRETRKEYEERRRALRNGSVRNATGEKRKEITFVKPIVGDLTSLRSPSAQVDAAGSTIFSSTFDGSFTTPSDALGR